MQEITVDALALGGSLKSFVRIGLVLPRKALALSEFIVCSIRSPFSEIFLSP
jgi:hypothetical protein